MSSNVDHKLEIIAQGEFSLVQKAKSKGGDKYKGELAAAKSGSSFPLEVYIPQIISRNGVTEPMAKISLSLSFPVEGAGVDHKNHNVVCLQLAKAAKGKGGDKYEGTVLDDKITLYLPQELSRISSEDLRQTVVLTLECADVIKLEPHVVAGSVAEMKGTEEDMDQEQSGVIAGGSFHLHAAAKGKGGDRYKGELRDVRTAAVFPLDVYVPQSLSRKTSLSSPLQELHLSVLDGDVVTPNSILLLLAKAAKGKGGDKFEGTLLGDKVTLYLPQELSRGSTAVTRGCVTLGIAYADTDGDETGHGATSATASSNAGSAAKRKHEGGGGGAADQCKETSHDRWLRELDA